jgi:hypothetical protein
MPDVNPLAKLAIKSGLYIDLGPPSKRLRMGTRVKAMRKTSWRAYCALDACSTGLGLFLLAAA